MYEYYYGDTGEDEDGEPDVVSQGNNTNLAKEDLAGSGDIETGTNNDLVIRITLKLATAWNDALGT